MKMAFDALRSMATGRPAQLDDKQLEALRVALLQGAMAHDFGTELWTLKRVRALIELKPLPRASCAAASAAIDHHRVLETGRPVVMSWMM